MNYFIEIQFSDLDVLQKMVDIAKGFGSQYCTFSISPSQIEIIGSDVSSVYIYVSYEISRNAQPYDMSPPPHLASFSIPHSIQNTEAAGEKWILVFHHEDAHTELISEKEIFVLPEDFWSEPAIGSFNVDMVLPDFYKVHCVGASMKNFNERIKISANNQGELRLETGHAMFNTVTCFNNCINHMDSVVVLERDNFKFVTINVDSAHFVKFFSVVKEDFEINFKIVDNYALLFEGEREREHLKVKLILPAKL
ncbi:26677_t:CDS:2 [Dentiscutata erythropus]|uniref:26677_t:CDS:1 n=1 Tax=Dentiscutata erythropus TaxID=1348616 RepID=A0A9N8W042_9GLOM|nr:26677_t:CDS:2 [Dentiscutata erythropus]